MLFGAQFCNIRPTCSVRLRLIGRRYGYFMSNVEAGKEFAAYKAVDEWLKDGQIVGIGSGTTVVHAVNRIAELVKKHSYNIKCVPTSYQALQLIKKAKLPLTSLTDYPLLDVAFDGVDEITADFNAIKGGGGCLIQEKIVDVNSKVFIAVADEGKLSKYLGERWTRGLPIEIIPMAEMPVKLEIEKRYGGEANLRMGVSKAGPVVSDNGNFIMDWKFVPSPSIDWQQINTELHLIPAQSCFTCRRGWNWPFPGHRSPGLFGESRWKCPRVEEPLPLEALLQLL